IFFRRSWWRSASDDPTTSFATIVITIPGRCGDRTLLARASKGWKRGGGMIRLVDVHRSFGPNHVLRGCSLEVRDGETLTIMGGSGTGKSVTLKLMVGLLKPNRGEIYVEDQDISHLKEEDLSEVQKKFAYVF